MYFVRAAPRRDRRRVVIAAALWSAQKQLAAAPGGRRRGRRNRTADRARYRRRRSPLSSKRRRSAGLSAPRSTISGAAVAWRGAWAAVSGSAPDLPRFDRPTHAARAARAMFMFVLHEVELAAWKRFMGWLAAAEIIGLQVCISELFASFSQHEYTFNISLEVNADLVAGSVVDWL